MARGRSSRGPSAASDARPVAAVTLAAQAAAQAVASLAQLPVGAEGADRARNGGAALTPPVQAPMIASSSPHC